MDRSTRIDHVSRPDDKNHYRREVVKVWLAFLVLVVAEQSLFNTYRLCFRRTELRSSTMLSNESTHPLASSAKSRTSSRSLALARISFLFTSNSLIKTLMLARNDS